MSNFELYFTLKEQPLIQSDEECMRLALDAAIYAKSNGDVPIGAALVWAKKHLVEHDTSESDVNPLNTASVNVLRKAFDMLPRKVSNGVLYCTGEPDAFDVLSAVKSGIREVVFGVYDYRNGFLSSSNALDISKYNLAAKGGV